MDNTNKPLNTPSNSTANAAAKTAAEAAKDGANKNLPNGTNSVEDDSLDREYIDERYVTISPVHNYSNYRRVNMKVLGHKKETIGSSIRSTQILSSDADEVNAYFPALIGISPTNPDFITRVKAWLSNIQFTVTEEEVRLDTTFIYKHKKDYLAIKTREDKINEEYDKIDRTNTSRLREALKRKIDALNTLESTKHKYGRPQNLEQYLMYRHCLLYNDVAKDTAFINSDPTIRFYIKDAAKEAEKQKKLVKQKEKAMENFVKLNGTDSKFNAVFLQIAMFRNDNLADAILKGRDEKVAIMIDFVNSNPDKFNKLVEDKAIEIKAFIETLILRGELVRSEYNQQISTADGTFIGSNMNQAIAWFENPDNKDVRTAYENKLKLI